MTTLSASDIAALRIREARQKRKWSVKDLAGHCKKAGFPRLTAAVITNLESRRRPGREISAEELLALARTLEVPPLQLLTPLGAGETLEIVPGENLGPMDTLAWMTDDYPPSQIALESDRDGNDRALPYKRSVLPVVRHLTRAVWRVRFATLTLADEGMLARSHEPASYYEESTRSSAERIRSQLAYLEAAGHDVTLPADVAEVIARYDSPEVTGDGWEDHDGASSGPVVRQPPPQDRPASRPGREQGRQAVARHLARP